METKRITSIIFVLAILINVQSLSLEKSSKSLRCPNGNGSVPAPIAPPAPPAPPVTPVPVRPTPTTPVKGDGNCKANETRFVSGVRYVRVVIPKRPDNYLQISQLVVKDVNGVNVAVKKPASESKIWSGCPAKVAVDGVAANRDGRRAPDAEGINCNLAIVDADPSGQPWWEVNLVEDYSIKQIIYYNRIGWSYRSIGMIVQLLDSSRNVLGLYEITNTNQIFCIDTI